MKTVYLLPNLITLCNLLCGYWSISFSLKGNFSQAAIMIFLCIMFDAFDGRIARMTNTISKFGFEFDSLSDLISFGLAPACIIYKIFALSGDIEKLAWWACFIYVVCGALRLARYNVQASNEEKEDFTGLPIPCAAGMIASYALFKLKYGYTITPYILLFLVIPLALLMVSTVRYSSMQVNIHKRKPFIYFVGAVIFLGLLVRFPHQVFLLLFSSYILSGLCLFLKEKVFLSYFRFNELYKLKSSKKKKKC